jgi:drug/metabolite transporter (DMT)-like permease
MNTGIEYALGAMLCFGISDLIYKRGAAAGALPHHLLMVQSWLFFPSVFLFGLLTHALIFTRAALWGSAAGLFMTVGFYNFAYSLRFGLISVNAPIFRLNFVITALLAVVLFGEPLGLSKIVAIGFALLAVWFLLAVSENGIAPAGGEGRSSLPRVIIATLFVGVGNVIYKFGLREGATPASLVVAQAMVVVTLSTAMAGFKDRRILLRVTLRFAPAAAVVLAFAFAFLIEGLAYGDASVIVPIAQMGFGVTALIGFLVLGEPITMKKGLGLLSALVSLTIFAYGLPAQ